MVLIYPVVSFLLSYVFYILRIILPFHQNIFRNFTNKKMDISKIIHDRSTPCIANQIRIRIFINDGYQVVFCISAVTRDDDMIFAVKFRHNLPDYGGCQFQFRLFFLPHTIAKRNGKMRYFIPIPDRYAEHDSHKAVSIQIVGTVVCGMVKQFWNIFKFCAKWDTIVSSTHRNTGYVCKESGISFKAILTVVFINLE